MSRRDGENSNVHDGTAASPSPQPSVEDFCDQCESYGPLDSTLPQYHSEPAELIGREGMVTVWDDLGRYVGCMGVNLWRHLLTVSGGPVDG